MGLTIDLREARPTFDEAAGALLDAALGTGEYELLGPSRCHGWTRLDVLVHVLGGWQEMLGGLVSRVAGEPTVDAASYWTAFAGESDGADPVAVLMAQRRRTAAYARPAAVCEQLADVGAAVRRGVRAMPDEPCRWQGHVFSAGDFLAVWAVEDVVHQLDLDLGGAVPGAALSLARRTIEALAGAALPAGWPDGDAVLVGTGRRPVPDGALAPELGGPAPGDPLAARLT